MPPEPLARLRAIGLTQVELAQLLCVGQSTISQWETGARKLPGLVLEDLWELLRLVEERLASGLEVRQAVQGWQPTVRFSAGGKTVIGVPIPLPMDAVEIAAKEGPAGLARLMREKTLADLTKAMEHPRTAEEWAAIRRLAITVKMDADGALRLKTWEDTDASHGEGNRPEGGRD